MQKTKHTIPYSPVIDGLRALSIVLVLLFHSKISFFNGKPLSGGLLGVDVFFVISGYLITKILITELQSSGSIKLKSFWLRRARRIFPSVLVVIFLSYWLGWFLLLPLEFKDFVQSAISALLFFSNFYFHYSTVEYGAQSSDIMPLLHTWSLGVEEQFFLFMPVLLLIFFKQKYNLTKQLVIILFSFSLASFLFNIYINEFDIFFVSPLRFWEILFGSLIFLYEDKFKNFKNSYFSYIGITIIFFCVCFFELIGNHPGILTVATVCSVGLILLNRSADTKVNSFLSTPFMVATGKLSYSLYLTHFPVFSFSKIYGIHQSTGTQVLLILVSILSASVLYLFVEKPIYRDKRFSNKQFLYGYSLLFSFIFALLLATFYYNGFTIRLPKIFNNASVESRPWHEYKKDGEICHGRQKNYCNEFYGSHLNNVFVFGDSHMSALSPHLVDLLKNKINYLEANGGCPFAKNIMKYDQNRKSLDSICSSKQEDRIALIPKKPSIIVLGGRFPLYLEKYYFDNLQGGIEKNAIFHAIYESERGISFSKLFETTVNDLLKDGHQLVLVYPIPEAGWNVPKEILRFFQKNLMANFEPMQFATSFKLFEERSRSTFELFDRLGSKNIYRVYPHEVFCVQTENGRCATHDSQEIYYADTNHLSFAGGRLVAPLVASSIMKADSFLRKKSTELPISVK